MTHRITFPKIVHMPFDKKVGNNRMCIDEKTQDLALEIKKMALGFTRDQFETALLIALEDADKYFILSDQPAH
jgi:hypothetical protein